MMNFDVDEVTYVDSDLFFFDKPEVLLSELTESKKDVLITKHNYTPRYDQTKTSGTYCVQFMTFKNNDSALSVLRWWMDRCDEWCYNRFEDGKFGDQRYLEDWTERFQCIHVLRNTGGGVAPWNIQQHSCSSGPYIDDKKIIFYHFHGLIWCSENEFDASVYRLSDSVRNIIYKPYLMALLNSLYEIRETIDPRFSMGIAGYPDDLLHYLKYDKYRADYSGCTFDNYIKLEI